MNLSLVFKTLFILLISIPPNLRIWGLFIKLTIVDADGTITEIEIPIEDLGYNSGSEYSAGIGRPSEIPWFRFCSKALSPSATKGWYCVYLFDADGEHVSLCLARGTTTIKEGEFIPNSRDDIVKSVDDLREALQQEVEKGLLDSSITQRLITEVDLNATTTLGKGYEASVVFGLRYEKGSIPPDETLAHDIVNFAKLLGLTYKKEIASTEGTRRLNRWDAILHILKATYENQNPTISTSLLVTKVFEGIGEHRDVAPRRLLED